MFKCLVVYKTKNNKTIFRVVEFPQFEIGDYNSHGWYVLDIQYYYKGSFHSKEEYERLFEEDLKKQKKKNNKWYKGFFK